MKIKQVVLFSMLFAALGTIGYVLPFGDISESVGTEGLKKEFVRVCQEYELIEKERNEEIEGLKRLGYEEKAKLSGSFFLDGKDQKGHGDYLIHKIEPRFCYFLYKKEILGRIISFAEFDKPANFSDVEKMYDGLHVGLVSPFPHINLDYDYQRAIRTKVKYEMNKLIITEWGNTTAKRIEKAMPEYQ